MQVDAAMTGVRGVIRAQAKLKTDFDSLAATSSGLNPQP